MEAGLEFEADLAAAVEGLSSVDGAYVLDAREDADAYRFAIVLSPWSIRDLVRAHYAVLEGTGERERILYVNAELPPFPMTRARRLWATEAAKERVAKRRAEAAERCIVTITPEELERAIRVLTEQASRDARPSGDASSPYRTTLVASSGGFLEVVRDPFPKPRILVMDDDPTTDRAVTALAGIDVTVVRDGWSAVEALSQGDFDLAICAVVLGEFTGARVYRMVTKLRPEMASRIALLASPSTVAQAPPSSAIGRVLSRPLDPEAVLALMRRA